MAELSSYARGKTLGSGRAGAYRGLSSQEYAIYTALFAILPGACVLVSSILYYVWRRDHPRKAGQINTLGFVVFGLQLLLGCGWAFLLPVLLG